MLSTNVSIDGTGKRIEAFNVSLLFNGEIGKLSRGNSNATRTISRGNPIFNPRCDAVYFNETIALCSVAKQFDYFSFQRHALSDDTGVGLNDDDA